MRRNYERIERRSGAFFVIAILVGGAMEGGQLQRGPTDREQGRPDLGATGLCRVPGVSSAISTACCAGPRVRTAGSPQCPSGAGLLWFGDQGGVGSPDHGGRLPDRRANAGSLANTGRPQRCRVRPVRHDVRPVRRGSGGGVAWPTGVLPRWLGWFGLASGLLTLAAGIVGVVDPMNYKPHAVPRWSAVDAGSPARCSRSGDSESRSRKTNPPDAVRGRAPSRDHETRGAASAGRGWRGPPRRPARPDGGRLSRPAGAPPCRPRPPASRRFIIVPAVAGLRRGGRALIVSRRRGHRLGLALPDERSGDGDGAVRLHLLPGTAR